MADKFIFSTPKGEMHEIKLENGSVKLEIKWNAGFGSKMTRNINSVQEFIDTECLRRSADFAPFDQHTLIESGILCTQIGSGEVKYRTPYARRLYYHPEYNFSTEHNPQAGGYWFERMKQQHKEKILAGAKRRAGGSQ